MTPEQYRELRAAIIEAGYQSDITWAEGIQPCASADDFALEHAYVVCNSGMKAQIARPIFERVKVALFAGRQVWTVFKHDGKAAAIETVWAHRQQFFDAWTGHDRLNHVDQALAWLVMLPWIGDITKYHLAKNLGVDCCKPDRHLVRIAAESGEFPHELCTRLSTVTGDRVRVVDSVLWRAANLGMV